MGILRIFIAAIAAAGVTFGLFLFMYQLVFSGPGDRAAYRVISGIRFGPVEIPDDVQTRNRRKPPEPPVSGKPPPPPRMAVSAREKPLQDLPRMDVPDIDIPLAGGTGLFIGNIRQADQAAEGDIIPLVVIRPMYPREAALAGMEGWVKVEFTITETGTVKNPRVVESQPSRVFNREAIRAILKWKFKPRVIEGIAVERKATQVIDFTLDKS